MQRFALKDNLVSKLLRSLMVFDNRKTAPDTTKPSEMKYENFECRRIRKVEIIVLGPFGYDVALKYGHEIERLRRFGDQIHYNTRNWIIYDKLLFKKGDAIDALKISESERLIRQSPYIVDDKIFVDPIPGSKDSVDVLVVVQDVFEFTGAASANPTVPNGNLSITDINFLGLGQATTNQISYAPQYAQRYEYNGIYNVPEIANTYVSAQVHYNTLNYNKNYGLILSRPFFSTTTHWAGGLDIEHYHTAFSFLLPNDSSPVSGLHNYDSRDFWVGYAFPLNENPLYRFKKSQLILSARVNNINYTSQYSFPASINQLYPNETFILGAIGFTRRDYYKDHYIFAFGKTEDIPLGYLFTVNSGPDFQQFKQRWYSGFKGSYGWNNSSLGYMYLSLEEGGFINSKQVEQGVINTEFFYFTNLIPLGQWQWRQYLLNEYTLGYNRMPGEFLTINGNSGLQRFYSPSLTGTQRWSDNFEADFFSPWHPLGFEMVLVAFIDDALIGNHNVTVLQSHLYQGYGAGIRFKNEHFIFNTLQLSFHYFPNAALVKANAWNISSSGSTSFQFQDFQFAEPYMAAFR